MNTETIINDQQWKEAIPDIVTLAQRCFDAVTKADESCVGEVSIMLTDDAHVQTLNATFRNKDMPTNVLSFPGVQEDGCLGDIALGFETCSRESLELDIAFTHHTAHLIIHGLLHLIGYDHIDEDDAELMESLEVRILATLGIEDPYKHMERS